MTVPRNPDTIRGPCKSMTCAIADGTFQPRRASPARTPTTREAKPSTRSGSRNGTPRSPARMVRRSSGAAAGDAGDPDAPHVRAAFQVFPFDLAAVLGLELVVEGLRIVVVHQEQRLARQQFRERAENQGVAVARYDVADVDGIFDACGHVISPVNDGGFNSSRNVRGRARSSFPGSRADPRPG